MKLRYSLIAPLFASFSLFALAGCSSKSSAAMPSETAAPTQAQTQEQAKSAVPAETESAAVSDIQLADLVQEEHAAVRAGDRAGLGLRHAVDDHAARDVGRAARKGIPKENVRYVYQRGIAERNRLRGYVAFLQKGLVGSFYFRKRIRQYFRGYDIAFPRFRLRGSVGQGVRKPSI